MVGVETSWTRKKSDTRKEMEFILFFILNDLHVTRNNKMTGTSIGDNWIDITTNILRYDSNGRTSGRDKLHSDGRHVSTQ